MALNIKINKKNNLFEAVKWEVKDKCYMSFTYSLTTSTSNYFKNIFLSAMKL